MTPPRRIFLLSPARLDGVRGRRLLDGRGAAACAARLGRGDAVPLCEVYTHISSLYFRGKWAYARAFAAGTPAAWVITPSRGLLEADRLVTLDDLRAFAREDIAADNARYREALVASARRIEGALEDGSEVVLLGSIASDKYMPPLEEVFGARLRFPGAFVGRGDMSRGGLMLRAVEAGRELEYVPARDAERRGSRPPRLGPR